MFINVFGKYLVRKGLLTNEQIVEIRTAQSKTRVKLGLIAVAEKLLTEKQAEEINRKQALMDKRFGDIAVDLGYLTLENVGHLLGLQGNPYMQFSQIVTDNGYLTLAEVEEQMENFKIDNQLTEEALEGFKTGDLDEIVPVFVKTEEVKEAAGVAIRTLNRLITTDLWIGESYSVDSLDCDNCVLQDLDGIKVKTIGFAADGDGLLVIADSFAGETFETVDMDALDAVGEVTNIINGLYATALSERDEQAELMPPSFYDQALSLKGNKFTVVPMEINRKPIKLLLSNGTRITV